MKIADLERRHAKELEAIKANTAQCKIERNALAEAMGRIAEVVANILTREDASGAASPNCANVCIYVWWGWNMGRIMNIFDNRGGETNKHSMSADRMTRKSCLKALSLHRA